MALTKILAVWSWAIVLISLFVLVKGVMRGVKLTTLHIGVLVVLFVGGIVAQFFVALHFTFGPTMSSSTSGFFNTNYAELIFYGGTVCFSFTATVLLSVLWVGMVVPPNPVAKGLVTLLSVILPVGAFASMCWAWVRAMDTIGHISSGEYFILFAEGGLDTILRT